MKENLFKITFVILVNIKLISLNLKTNKEKSPGRTRSEKIFKKIDG